MNRDQEATTQAANATDIIELNDDALELVNGAGGVPDWG